MARSLTINHTEKPATSPLFNAFILLALGWMALAAITSASADAEPTTVESGEAR
ncbi:MAG: hypothetical protein AAFV53_08555 [Myxococcota bacterium]